MVDEDGAVLIDALANDAESEGGALKLFSAAAPAVAGVVEVVDTPQGQRLPFTPAADLTGPVALGYRVGDAAGNAATGAVAVEVTPVPDAPGVSGPAKATVAEDAAPIALDLVATASDPYAGDGLSVVTPGAPPAGVTLAGATLTADPSSAAHQSLARARPWWRGSTTPSPTGQGPGRRSRPR